MMKKSDPPVDCWACRLKKRNEARVSLGGQKAGSSLSYLNSAAIGLRNFKKMRANFETHFPALSGFDESTTKE